MQNKSQHQIYSFFVLFYEKIIICRETDTKPHGPAENLDIRSEFDGENLDRKKIVILHRTLHPRVYWILASAANSIVPTIYIQSNSFFQPIASFTTDVQCFSNRRFRFSKYVCSVSIDHHSTLLFLLAMRRINSNLLLQTWNSWALCTWIQRDIGLLCSVWLANGYSSHAERPKGTSNIYKTHVVS